MAMFKWTRILFLMIWFVSPSFKVSSTDQAASRQPLLQEQPDADRQIAYETTQHLYGSISVIASDGQIVYAANGNELLILSASSPNHLRRVSQPLKFAAMITDLHWSGNRLVVASGTGGISLLDVGDPLQPARMGTWVPGGTVNKVYLHGDRVYSVDSNFMLHVIDASNPQALQERGVLALPGFVYTLAANGDWLYASCGSQGMVIINAADPLNPAQTGSFDVTGDERRFVLEGNTGYLLTYDVDDITNHLDLRLHSVDFSSPAQPEEIDWLSVDGMGALAVQGDYAYLSFFYRISIVNIANPHQLTQSGYLETSGTVSELLVNNAYGYAATSEGRLHVLDFTYPAAPILVGAYQQAGITSYQAASGSSLILGLNNSTRLQVFDLSGKGEAKEVGSLDLTCIPNSVYAFGRYLYSACYDGNLYIYDVIKPTQPALVGVIGLPDGLRDLAVSNSRLYVLGYQALTAFDMTNLASPVTLGSLAVDAEKVEASGSLVYLLKSNSGLSVVDAANPGTMSIGGTFPINSAIQGVAALGSYVYISTGYFMYSENAVYVVDITQPNQPSLVTSISLPNLPTGLNLVGNRLFVPLYYKGIIEFDLSDPRSPVLLNDLLALEPWNITPPTAIYAAGDHIAVASPQGGVTLLQRVWTDRTSVQPDGQPYPGLAGKVAFTFPAGSLYGGSLSINYERTQVTSLGGKLVAGPVFYNRMWDNISEQPFQPSAPFSLTVNYDPARLNIIDESSIGLYALKNGVWMLEEGSLVHPAEHTVTASPASLRPWAVLGEPRQSMYLPLASRNHVAYPDLMLNRLEITQAVQRPDLSVPLVAGRDTVLRVHVASDRPIPVDDVVVSVSASQNNLPLAGSPITFGPWAVFPNPYPGNSSDSFNFSLPAEWLNGNVNLSVRMNPQKSIAETSYLNNDQTLALAFNPMPPLDYKIVPVNYTDEQSGTLYPGPTEDTLTTDIWRMYPLHQINTSFRLAMPWSGDLSEDGEWNRFLNDLTDLKYSDEAPDSMAYYGAISGGDSLAWAGMGWIGMRASVGIDYTSTAAHELGHNFGRGHVPCGVDGDEDYPYPNGDIGQWGFDVYSNQVFPPNEYKDFMSYCGPEWVSDYTYMGLYEDQRENGLRSNAEAAPGNYYWIRLRLEEDGRATLKPVYILGKSYPLEGESSGYTAVLLDEGGAAIQSFVLPLLRAVSEGSEHLGIYATLPVPENGAGAIVIEKDGQEIARQALDPGDGQNLPEQAAVTKEPDGWRLSWREAGTAARVRVSTDGGQTWTTLALDLTASEFKIAETPEVAAGAWLEVSFSNRSLPERVVLSAE